MPIIGRFAKNIRRMQALLTRLRAFLGIVLLLTAPLAGAQLSIEITGAGALRMPIAIAPFPGEGALGPGITSIVRADLERSGLLDRKSTRLNSSHDQISYAVFCLKKKKKKYVELLKRKIKKKIRREYD